MLSQRSQILLFLFILYSVPCQQLLPFCFSAQSSVFLPHLFWYWFLLVYFSFLLLYSSTLVGLYFSNSLLKLLITSLCIHSFPESRIIFTIVTLNSFSGKLPISTSLVVPGFYLIPSSGTYPSPGSFFKVMSILLFVFLCMWKFGYVSNPWRSLPL